MHAQKADFSQYQTADEREMHLRSMCDEIPAIVAHHHTEKAMRWLGFMQGVLWAGGYYTLNDLRKHNAPDCEDK
jgi:hypothetical protein